MRARFVGAIHLESLILGAGVLGLALAGDYFQLRQISRL